MTNKNSKYFKRKADLSYDNINRQDNSEDITMLSEEKRGVQKARKDEHEKTATVESIMQQKESVSDSSISDSFQEYLCDAAFAEKIKKMIIGTNLNTLSVNENLSKCIENDFEVFEMLHDKIRNVDSIKKLLFMHKICDYMLNLFDNAQKGYKPWLDRRNQLENEAIILNLFKKGIVAGKIIGFDTNGKKVQYSFNVDDLKLEKEK